MSDDTIERMILETLEHSKDATTSGSIVSQIEKAGEPFQRIAVLEAIWRLADAGKIEFTPGRKLVIARNQQHIPAE